MFEKYIPQMGRRPIDGVKVTVYGLLYFGKILQDKLGWDIHHRVDVYIDRDNDLIGIKPHKDGA